MSSTLPQRLESELPDLSAKTGEEYHKLHSGKQEFALTNGRITYYEKEFAKALSHSVLEDMLAMLPPLDTHKHMTRNYCYDCQRRDDHNKLVRGLRAALTAYCIGEGGTDVRSK